LVDEAMEAHNQALVIHTHTMGITEGKTYTEMDREDPARATYISSLTLQNSLHLAHLGLELSLFVIGAGVAFTGIGAATLVLGLPLVNKILALK
jgi:O-acetyl-ADP-ribose deacetylase (regulator of RNase III)